ncbi:MAG TPA: M1 family metallopeptidase [Kofleriaceae bacterium]|nr:M1 family metallopeptidase [Kofleriaceae bacterium]
MRRMVLALAVLGLACPAPAPPPPAPPPRVVAAPPPVDAAPPPLAPPQPTLRLPRNFTPTGYQARLAIDPTQATFTGQITITGTVSELSSVIWLHGYHLRVMRATAASDTASARQLEVTPRGEDLLEVRAEPAFAAGTWHLSFDYTGEIDSVDTTGAFKEVVKGEPYVFSQLEAVYARRVFPCVDEPDRKVPWQITLDVPKPLTAVSNAPEVSTTELDSRWKRVEFAPTRPLPSYLIAFGVGPFDVVDAGKTREGMPIRIVALHGRAGDAAYAAKTAPRIVELLEDWFGMPFPYDKLDLLSIPLTVGFGAMENAGLDTFTERLILFDPAHASWERRQTWVIVAAHELAHQWFGDLVTMAWWDDIWLNEGFANWMEQKIGAQFDPSWHVEDSALDTKISALEADSVVTARKIRQPIAAPDDIYNAFDGITYDKGASVLDMFERYVGPDLFQRGVRDYLKAHAYGNATSADFVAAISAAAGKDLAPAFSTFLDQAGEPELELALRCDGGRPRVALSQQRYVPPGSPPPAATQPWIVPVCMAYERAGKRAEQCALLDKATDEVALDSKSCPRWVMPDAGGTGYYRTAPTVEQVKALRDEAWPQLTWIERRAVFFDVSESARVRRRGRRADVVTAPTTRLPLPLALSFVPKLMAGDRFAVGEAIALPLGLDRFVPDELRGKYEAWLRALFSPGADKLGALPKESDDADAERMRVELFGVAAWTGRDPALVAQAVELAARWRDLPPAMRGSILETAVDASPELFDRVLADVKAEPDRVRRGEMIGALGAVRDPAELARALPLLLDRSFDLRESLRILLGTSTEATREVAEKFFRNNEQAIMERVPHDEVTAGVAGLVDLFTSACDPKRRDEVADYVTAHFARFPGGDRVVKQEIEAMDQCIASRAVLEPELRGWLGGVKIPKPEPGKTGHKR